MFSLEKKLVWKMTSYIHKLIKYIPSSICRAYLLKDRQLVDYEPFPISSKWTSRELKRINISTSYQKNITDVLPNKQQHKIPFALQPFYFNNWTIKELACHENLNTRKIALLLSLQKHSTNSAPMIQVLNDILFAYEIPSLYSDICI